MKIYLALISAAAFALSACGGQEAAAPAEQPAAASEAPASEMAEPASEAASAADSAQAVPAEGCEVVVSSDDQMKFDKQELEIKKSCKEFKIVLKHAGTMPKAAMGHNIVISKAEDAQGVVSDGAGATAEKNFVKEGDERVIAYTPLIGGGEETSVTVDTSKFAEGSQYEFYCTFPGHYGMMHGTVKLI
ncbi:MULTISPECIES: azurin [unclassified Neisseria]|uniref:azurin n=1 Tax=unclassified Neisseria TaxID=2623750 RepID=UPI0010717DB2|nr:MULTISPECIES: azurin [unclassified Neisseria]MBF0802990.1 azurin [Neisseria sp. 19428wB4_WF04]TFU44514.1 azurin [Neisseria sp. WF04]